MFLSRLDVLSALAADFGYALPADDNAFYLRACGIAKRAQESTAKAQSHHNRNRRNGY